MSMVDDMIHGVGGAPTRKPTDKTAHYRDLAKRLQVALREANDRAIFTIGKDDKIVEKIDELLLIKI